MRQETQVLKKKQMLKKMLVLKSLLLKKHRQTKMMSNLIQRVVTMLILTSTLSSMLPKNRTVLKKMHLLKKPLLGKEVIVTRILKERVAKTETKTELWVEEDRPQVEMGKILEWVEALELAVVDRMVKWDQEWEWVEVLQLMTME